MGTEDLGLGQERSLEAPRAQLVFVEPSAVRGAEVETGDLSSTSLRFIARSVPWRFGLWVFGPLTAAALQGRPAEK